MLARRIAIAWERASGVGWGIVRRVGVRSLDWQHIGPGKREVLLAVAVAAEVDMD